MIEINETKLDVARARETSREPGIVWLNLDEMDYLVACELRKFRGEELHFGELPEMDDEAARELTKVPPDVLLIEKLVAIYYPNIQAGTILRLAKSVDHLNLQGIAIDSSTVKFLEGYKGWQLLIDQESLDQQSASRLARASPDLLSIGLESLDAEVAYELAFSRADELQIVGPEINALAASALANFVGRVLWISGDIASPEAALELARFPGLLYVDIIKLSIPLAQALGTFEDSLELPLLEELSAELAQALVGKPIQSQVNESASSLCHQAERDQVLSYPPVLILSGISKIDPEVVKILARCKRLVRLPNLRGKSRKLWEKELLAQKEKLADG